jgi:predicted permease
MAHIRYALRSLAKSPLLSLAVVLSLGLGIGANTAIFSLLHQVLLAALPAPHPEELALLTSPKDFKSGRTSTGKAGDMEYIFNYPVFRRLEEHAQGVTGVAAFRTLDANLAYRNQTVHGSVMVVSGRYFPVLGVRPAIGRTLLPADDVHGAGVAVIGYGYWRDKLGGEADVLNRNIRINGQNLTIVGVAPPGFNGITLGEQPDAYVPLALKPLLTPGWNGTDRYNDHWLYLFARRKTGVTLKQAEAALNSVYRGAIEPQATALHYGPKTTARLLDSKLTLKDGSRGNSSLRDDSRTPILILTGATIMVLLIAMANAANLMLARSAQRRRELAIRAAMGASRAELMVQLLTEALLLAGGGAIAGLAVGAATLQFLVAQMGSGDAPVYFLTTTLEWPVLLYGAGLALLTGLLFGIYPAWEAARTAPASTLKNEAGQTSGARGVARVRRALVCTQVMVSAALLIPTGLFLKSLINLMRVDLGMRTQNVVTFAISPQMNGYSFDACRALFERVEAELAAIPGARGVAAAMVAVIGGDNSGNGVTIPGITTYTHSYYNEISPGFFGKLGIPLMAGREFTERDNLAGPPVAIVNQEFVTRYYPARNPIGQQFRVGNDPSMTIVGIVRNSHYAAVKEDPYPVYYIPWRQDPKAGVLSFYVPTALPTEQMIPQVRRVMRSIDANLPAEALRTLDNRIGQSISTERLILQLSAAFAILATALAMLGLYGVMAYNVTRRTREIGIRLALGANPAAIRRMVMREMVWILGIGLVIGVPAALALARLTESQLYGVKSFDATVFTGAVLALAITAAAAAYVPASRAAKVSPTQALRYE